MTNQEPLLDADWLLGVSNSTKPWWYRFSIQSSLAVAVIAIVVFVWPWLSNAWLEDQFIAQYQVSRSIEEKDEAMNSLVELLPQSLSAVVAGLAATESGQARFAFKGLEHYIDHSANLPIEQRRAALAELVLEMERILPSLPDDSWPLVRSLTSRIGNVDPVDSHPGTQVMLAACQRILRETQTRSSTALISQAAPIANELLTSTRADSKVRLSLSDSPSEEIVEPSEPKGFELAATDPSPANGPIHGTLPSTEQAPLQSSLQSSLADGSMKDESIAVPASGQLRQRLQQASRYVPLMSSARIPIQVDSAVVVEDGLERIPSQLSGSFVSTSVTPSRVVAIDEEFVGIKRQTTEYLISLLGSSTPRLASAAFQELRTRLSSKELDVAVELAQGTTEQRMQTMERLVKEPEINPIIWLAWMGSEADRDVRFKAVSLLGSFNSEDARLKLRLMHNRERDLEISRHIQNALLASGPSKSLHR